jgi:hypothetical protein
LIVELIIQDIELLPRPYREKIKGKINIYEVRNPIKGISENSIPGV